MDQNPERTQRNKILAFLRHGYPQIPSFYPLTNKNVKHFADVYSIHTVQLCSHEMTTGMTEDLTNNL